jgi:hypothetical protein
MLKEERRRILKRKKINSEKQTSAACGRHRLSKGGGD